MFFIMESLMKELASRGHHVTVVSHFPQKAPVPNYTDISIRGSLPITFNNISYDSIKRLNHVRGVLNFLFVDEIENCRLILEHKNIQKLKSSTKRFDLIITQAFGSDCLLGFVHIFHAPVITLNPNQFFPWMSERVGNSDNTAYIPYFFTGYTPSMNLLERVHNTITVLRTKWEAHTCERAVDKLARKHFGESLPPLWELKKKTSVIFVASHFSMQQARPNVPAVVEVGGLHIRTPKQPPEVCLPILHLYCLSSEAISSIITVSNKPR
jgi:glucuronosyltransferase